MRIWTPISDLLTIVMLFLTLQTFFPPKTAGIKQIPAFALCAVLGMAGIVLLEITIGSFWLYLAAYFVVGILYAHVFLRGETVSKILLALIYCSFFLQLNAIEQYAFSRVAIAREINRPFIAQILIFLLMSLTRSVMPDGRWRLPSTLWMIIMTISIACGASSHLMTTSFSADDPMLALFQLVIFLLNLTTVYLCLRLASDYDNRLQLQFINSRLEMEHRKMAEMEDVYQSTRELRHDLNNHMLILSSMAEKRDFESMVKYLAELQPEKYRPDDSFDSGNALVNIILNQKLAQAKRIGIDLTVHAMLPAVLNIQDTDLSALLFNLIDNAFEAARNAERRRVHVDLGIAKNYLRITTSNGVDTDVLAENPLLATTKPDPENHGIGMTIIRTLVEKYDGIMKYQMQEGELYAYIMLRLNALG